MIYQWPEFSKLHFIFLIIFIVFLILLFLIIFYFANFEKKLLVLFLNKIRFSKNNLLEYNLLKKYYDYSKSHNSLSQRKKELLDKNLFLNRLIEWYYFEIDNREENRIFLKIIRNIFFTSKQNMNMTIQSLKDIEKNEPVAIESKKGYFNFGLVLDCDETLKRVKIKVLKTFPDELVSEVFVLYFYRFGMEDFYAYSMIVNFFGENIVVFKLSTNIRKLEKHIMTEKKIPIKIKFFHKNYLIESDQFEFVSTKFSARGAKIVFLDSEKEFVKVFKNNMFEKIKQMNNKKISKLYIDDFIVDVSIFLDNETVKCSAKIKDIYKNEINTYFLLFHFNESEEEIIKKKLNDYIEKNFPTKENF